MFRLSIPFDGGSCGFESPEILAELNSESLRVEKIEFKTPGEHIIEFTDAAIMYILLENLYGVLPGSTITQ